MDSDVENDFIDFKKIDNLDDFITSNIEKKNYSLDEIIINIFSAEKCIKGIVTAYEYMLSQIQYGIYGNYIFTYPNLGSIKYDHNSIYNIYKLANSKSLIQLYNIFNNDVYNNNIRLNHIASFIIKHSKYFYYLFNTITKAKKNIKDNKLFYITLTNPFKTIINTRENSKYYEGKELLRLYKIGTSKTFETLFV